MGHQSVADIEDFGLTIISWDLSDDDDLRIEFQGGVTAVNDISFDTIYAVSIDATEDGNPSLEQKECCDWWMSPELAAAAYDHAPASR